VSADVTTAAKTDETTEATGETTGATAAERGRGCGPRSIAWWNCSRIFSISLNASANHRIVVVLPWSAAM
jgi:hypothetical protein